MAEIQQTLLVDEIDVRVKESSGSALQKIAEGYENTAKAAGRLSPAMGHAASSMEHAGHAAQAAGKHHGELAEKFNLLKEHGLMMAVSVTGVGLSLGALTEKAYEANVEFGRVKKTVTSANLAFSSWKQGTDMTAKVKASAEAAAETTEKFDDLARSIAMPLEEIGRIYTGVAGPMMEKLGKGQEDVFRMTTLAASAAKVFGVEGSQAANVITRALETRTVRGIDTFSVHLRHAVGNLHKLSQPEAYKRIEASLREIAPAAVMMSQGLGDQVFRIKEFFEDVIRGVSGPVFKGIVEMFQQWQKKLEASGSTVQEIAEKWGVKLLGIFKEAVSLVEKLADNWKWLAAAWLAFKAPGWMTALGGLGGGLGGILGDRGLVKSTGAWETYTGRLAGKGGIESFGATLGITVAALAGFKMALEAAADSVDKWQNKQMAQAGSTAAMDPIIKAIGEAAKTEKYLTQHAGGLEPWQIAQGKEHAKAQLLSAQEELKKAGLLVKGNFQMQKFVEIMGQASDEMLARYQKLLAPMGLTSASATDLGTIAGQYFAKNVDYSEAQGAIEKEDLTTKKPPVFNIGTINITQDFKDTDPDRVFISFKEGVEQQSRAAVGSRFAFAEEH